MFNILWKAPRRAKGPWVIHSIFWWAMSSSFLSSSFSPESNSSSSNSFGSSLPPPPLLLPSPLPPVPNYKPKIMRVSRSPYRKTIGSSLSSTTLGRPSSVARTASSTHDKTTPMGVVSIFHVAYGRWCIPGISPTSFTNRWVMIQMGRSWWYGISCSHARGEE